MCQETWRNCCGQLFDTYQVWQLYSGEDGIGAENVAPWRKEALIAAAALTGKRKMQHTSSFCW